MIGHHDDINDLPIFTCAEFNLILRLRPFTEEVIPLLLGVCVFIEREYVG